MKFLLSFLGVTALLFGGLAFVPQETNFGAFGDPFLSIQLATSPANGECLTTDGTNNDWGSCGGSSSSDPELTYGLNEYGQISAATSSALEINSVGTSTFKGGLEAWRLISAPYFVSTSTATSTFAGGIDTGLGNHIKTHGIISDASDGLHIHSANGTNVGIFGAGNTANSLFYGGVNIDGATRLATSLTGLLKATAGAITTATAGTDYENPLTFSFPLLRTTNAISFIGLSTTSPWTIGELAYVNANNRLTSVATGTVASGNGISVTAGQSIIGSGLTIANTGVLSNVAGSGITVSGATGNVTIATNDRDDIATTTDIAISQLAYFTKTGGLTTMGGVATTSASCSGTVSCSAFTVLGASPITITGAGGGTFGQTWDMFTKGFIAPTSTASVVIGATSTESLKRNALFQVNATSTLGDLITASSTPNFQGYFLKFNNPAGTDLLTVDSAGEIRGLGASGNASFVFAPASSQVNLWRSFEGDYFSFGSLAMSFFHSTGKYNFIEDSGNFKGVLDFKGLSSDKEFVFPNITGTVGIGTATTTSSLSYWQTGGSLGAVATTTMTATSPLSLSQPVVKVGGSNSVLTISTTTNSLFTGTAGQVLGYTNLGWVGVATTTAGTGLTYTGSAFNVNTTQNITALSNLTTNALVLTGSGNGTLGAYTGAGCTNQVIEDLSVLGAPTCVSINNGYWSGTDLSVANGGTGLSTFGGTNTVLYTTAAGTLASEAAFTYVGTNSQDLLTASNASTTALTVGNSFKLPSLAALVTTIAGYIGIDTTSEQLRWYGGATNATQVALRTYEPSLVISSTTPDASFTDYRTGTTSLRVANKLRAMTLSHIYCKTTNNTMLLIVGDSTASTTHATCTPGGTSVTSLSNNTFTSREDIWVGLGSATTTDPNSVTITLSFTETVD